MTDDPAIRPRFPSADTRSATAPARSAAAVLAAGAATLFLLACGGDPGGDGSAAVRGATGAAESGASAPTVDRSVSIEIPDEELGDLSRENLGLALRWTTSRIAAESRADATPATTIASIDYSVVAGLDRMVLTFSGDGTLPSYEVASTVDPVERCEGSDPVQSRGQGLLRIRFSSVQVDSSVVAAIPEDAALGNVLEAHDACRAEGVAEWVLDVERPTYYRILHLSDPTRLVVDVRHNLDGSPATPATNP